MYEELVKRLRERATWINFPHHGEECPNEDAMLMMKAADAIEDLSRDLDSMNEANIALYGALPKWIPVVERLPEDLERVLINDEDGVTIGTMDVFVGNEETYYEWHDTHCYRVFPTHWMPLPEPPKEET